MRWREIGFKINSNIYNVAFVLIKPCNFIQWKHFTLPLTISWAKLDTPEPSSDWVTQRYKSWSVFVTSCSLKEAANLLWLMFLVWATGISSPFRLCKRKPIFKKQVLSISTNLKHLSNQYLWQMVLVAKLVENICVVPANFYQVWWHKIQQYFF